MVIINLFYLINLRIGGHILLSPMSSPMLKCLPEPVIFVSCVGGGLCLLAPRLSQ